MKDSLLNSHVHFAPLVCVTMLLIACGGGPSSQSEQVCEIDRAVEPKDCAVLLEESTYVINSADDFDVFCNSPCTRVEGGVTIDGVASLQNLKPLSRLRSIGGELAVKNNSQLESLEGLDSLRSVLALHIENNDQLEDLRGLESLDGPIAKFNLWSNENIETLAGLGPVRSVAVDEVPTMRIDIYSNQNLKDIDAFHHMQDLGKNGAFYLRENPSLRSVAALDRLTRLSSIRVTDNSSLETIEGFSSLERAYGMIVEDNPKLPTCRVMEIRNQLDELEWSSITNNGTGECN